jgi:HK97 family phage portal protein
MVGHTDKSTSWGTGIEQMMIGFVMFTLQPYLKRAEQELTRKLVDADGMFFEFETNGLLRGDSKARSEYFKAGLGGSAGPGWMSPNEVRRLENLPEIPGGDSLSSWKQVGAQPSPTPAPANPDDLADQPQ